MCQEGTNRWALFRGKPVAFEAHRRGVDGDLIVVVLAVRLSLIFPGVTFTLATTDDRSLRGSI